MPQKAQLLIVDDDANTLASLSRAFRLAGHEATVCDNAARALELAKTERFDLVFSDVVMPGKDGLALLEDLKAQGVPTPVVMISGQAHIEMAVRATRLGAIDFLEKPLSTEKLLLTVENVLRTAAPGRRKPPIAPAGSASTKSSGSGEAMRRVMAQVERVAASETRVCILGETGTGKELIARTLHERARARRPIRHPELRGGPAELIESELFGHEKGSFTGAAARHSASSNRPSTGQYFWMKSETCRSAMQAKLLRVLEEGEVERIGGDRAIPVDVRVVVATHRNLEASVARRQVPPGSLSSHLCFSASLPPLRERREDIPALVDHFARQVAAINGWKPNAALPPKPSRSCRQSLAGQRPRIKKRGGAPAAAGNFRRSTAETVALALPASTVASGSESGEPAHYPTASAPSKNKPSWPS